MSRRREGGECVGKGRGAWVWRALCLRQAARGACTCWEVASVNLGCNKFLDTHGAGVSMWGDGKDVGEAPQNISWKLKPVPGQMC